MKPKEANLTAHVKQCAMMRTRQDEECQGLDEIIEDMNER